MGYLFLFTSLLAGSTKGYCGKQISQYINTYRDATLANFVRMFLCILISLGITIFSGNTKLLQVNHTTLLITLLSGISNSVFVVLWLFVVQKGAYMMIDIFCTLGILIPLIGCAALFGEAITLKHIIGIAILLIAVCIMCSYNNSIKSRLSVSTLILLLLCGIANGLADFSQKLFVNFSGSIPVAVFNFYSYVFSAAVLFCCYIIFSRRTTINSSTNIKPIMIYIPIMSVCLFLNLYCKTLAAHYLSSVQLYPLAQGGTLILSAIMSAIFFSENPNLRCIIGIILSFIALIIINVL